MRVTFIVILLVLGDIYCFAQSVPDSTKKSLANQSESDLKKAFSVLTSKFIQLSGYTQIRYQMFDEKAKNDGFDIRRARLDARGAFTPSINYRLQLDFVSSPSLLDAYGEFKLNKSLVFTLGQYRIPFSLENMTAETSMESIDRSQVVEALVSRTKDVIGNQGGRDIGLQVGGNLIKINDLNLIEYYVGLFNGAGVNTADNNKNKDVSGRLILHPIKGIAVGSSFYNGMGYYGTRPKSHIRNRFGLDLAVDFANASFRSEYIRGKDSTINRAGYYLQAGYYVFPKKLQLLLKYDVYDPDKDLSGNVNTYYIVCVTYIIAPNIRTQVSYSLRREESVQIRNNYGVVQFQIGF